MFNYSELYGPSEIDGPYFCCLAGADIALIKLLLGYAKRRINWDSGTLEHIRLYAGITDSEYQTVIDNIQRIEGNLMGVICISDIVDVLSTINDTIAAMASCVCQATEYQERIASGLPEMAGYVDAGLVTYQQPDDTQASPSVPGTDAEKCELAQSMYQYVYQLYTETLLPYASSTADSLTAAIVATTLFAGLASFVGMPISILASIVAVVISWGVDGSIANFTNWLLGIKDEYICTLYSTYPDYDAAAAAVSAMLDAQTELSFLDRLIAKSVMASAWHMRWISLEQQTNGTYDAYIVPGYCGQCLDYPAGCIAVSACNLSDWDGGTVVCDGGYAQVRGGSSRYTGIAVTLTAGEYLSFAWYPRADVPVNPRVDVNIVTTDGIYSGIVWTDATGPRDVLKWENWQVTPTWDGREVYLIVDQDSYWCELRAICTSSTPKP